MSDNAQKPVIKISDILAKLAAGVSRKQIAIDLGVSYASAQKNIFSHPKLKNRKTRPAADFILEDDAPDAPVAKIAEATQEVAEVAATETVVEEVAAEVATQEVDADAKWRE